MASGNLLCDTGRLNLGLCDDQEGCDGEGGGERLRGKGRNVCLWLIHAHVWQKLTQFCKPIILQLKK